MFEFCSSRGLSFGTLDRHLKKRRWKRKSAPADGRLVPVELAAKKSPTQHEASCGLAGGEEPVERLDVHRPAALATFACRGQFIPGFQSPQNQTFDVLGDFVVDLFHGKPLHQLRIAGSVVFLAADSPRGFVAGPDFFQCWLLSDGAVSVDPLARMEVVTLHTLAKQKKEDCQDDCKQELTKSERGWLSSCRSPRVQRSCHQICLPRQVRWLPWDRHSLLISHAEGVRCRPVRQNCVSPKQV